MHRLAFNRSALVSSRPIASVFLRALSGMPVQSRLQPSISALAARPLPPRQLLRPNHFHFLVRQSALTNSMSLSTLLQKASSRVSSIARPTATAWRTLSTAAMLHPDASTAKPELPATPEAIQTQQKQPRFFLPLVAPHVLPPWETRLKALAAELVMCSAAVAVGQGTVFAALKLSLSGIIDLEQSDLLHGVAAGVTVGDFVTMALYAYLATRYDRWQGGQANVPPRPRHWWLAVLLVLAYGINESYNIDVMMHMHTFGSDTGEEPILARLFSRGTMLDRLSVMVTGPLQEEVVFRVLLFGRLLRACGAPLAYIVSSAVFGIVHWTPNSEKVSECAVAGLVLAGTYAITGTFLAPALTHIVWNSWLVMGHRGISPTLPKEEIWFGDSLDVVCHDLMQLVVAARWPVRSLWYVGNRTPESLVTIDGQPTELLTRLTDRAFDLLDTQRKGYLSADQIAFFLTLDEHLLYRLLKQPQTQAATAVALPSNKQVRTNDDEQVRAAEALIMDMLRESGTNFKQLSTDITRINECFIVQLYGMETPSLRTKKALAYSQRLAALLSRSGIASGSCSREAFQQYVQRKALESPQHLEQMLYHLFAIAANRADHPLNSVHIVLRQAKANGSAPYKTFGSLLPSSLLRST